MEQRRPVNIGQVLALAWLFAAVGVTVVFGPQLGARGWLWLGAHHLLCLVGVTHELFFRGPPKAPPAG